MVKIIVGSKNPSKIRGVKKAFEKMFKENVIIASVSVKTSVHPQPIGLENVIRGAIERAVNAKKKAKELYDYYVGVEAGIIPIPCSITGYMDFQVSVIVDNEDRISLGFGPGFEFPKEVVDYVVKGLGEAEDVMEKISGIRNIGDKMGAIGFLTRNIVTREKLSELATIMALIPRLNAKLYTNLPKVGEVLKKLH